MEHRSNETTPLFLILSVYSDGDQLLGYRLTIVLDFNHYILLFMKCNAMYSKLMICHTVFFKFLFSVAQFGLPTAYVTSVLAYIKLKAWNFVVWQVKMMRTRA